MTEEIKSSGLRHQSRLEAVKALYSGEINEKSDSSKSPETLALEIISLHQDAIDDKKTIDEDFVTKIIIGVCTNKTTLDEKIEKHLGESWKLNRLGPVLHCILRAGVFELLHFNDTPLKVIINEYVNVTRGFYDEKEVGFVNGILDKIGHETRDE